MAYNVIPSFRGFASTPDTAGAYIGGARIGLQQQELANDVVNQRNRLEVERARIAQQAQESQVSSQIAQMRVAAQQQQAQEEALRRSTELDVERAYNNARLGLQARQLDQSQGKIDAEANELKRQLELQQMGQRRVGSGEDPEKVWFELGPGAGVSAAQFSAMGRDREASMPRPFGSAAAGYHQQDPKSGEVRQLVPPVERPDSATRISPLDLEKYRAAQRVLSGPIKTDKPAAQRIIDEIDRKYNGAGEEPNRGFNPTVGNLRLSESQSGPRKMTWDSKQRKLVPQ